MEPEKVQGREKSGYFSLSSLDGVGGASATPQGVQFFLESPGFLHNPSTGWMGRPLAKLHPLPPISLQGWKGLPLVTHIWVPHDSPVQLLSSSFTWKINFLY